MRWLAHENFNNNILPALFREGRDFDIVRAEDAALAGANDETLLEWAAGQGRVLLTHDVSTITAHAYQWIMKGEPLPGVFLDFDDEPESRELGSDAGLRGTENRLARAPCLLPGAAVQSTNCTNAGRSRISPRKSACDIGS